MAVLLAAPLLVLLASPLASCGTPSGCPPLHVTGYAESGLGYHGHNNIPRPGAQTSAACCADFCDVDPACVGFHLYAPDDPCLAAGQCFLHHESAGSNFTANSKCRSFVRNGTPRPTPPSNFSGSCTPHFNPNQTLLNGHPLALDADGKILTWLDGEDPKEQLVNTALEFLASLPLDNATGLPVYYCHGQLPYFNHPHDPANMMSQWTEVAMLLHQWNGSKTWMQPAFLMMEYIRANGTTASNDEWPSVPYASSDPGATKYRGSGLGNVSHMGDGSGVIEPDKIGLVGTSYLKLYKLDPSNRPQLLKAAVRCAATLVAKINLGANESISPWPFRVYAATGEVVQHYSSHVLGNIVFLDSLLSIPGAVNASTARAIQSARDFAWKWQARFPLLNSRWCGFCEDIRDPDENDADGNCDYDSIQWGLLARYLMDNADTHPEWENTVPELLQYVESHLIFWDKPGPHSPPVQWGARCVSEQKVDPNRMSCHTSRYASVLSQYAALHAARNASAAAALHKAAERSWAWASYCMQHSGNILVTPHQGESDAWFAVTIDVVLNTLHMMLSGTQHAHISTPVRRSHILRTSSVVTSVSYSPIDAIGGEMPALKQLHPVVNYTTFDAVSTETLQVSSHCAAHRVEVMCGGVELPERNAAPHSVRMPARPLNPSWALDRTSGILRVTKNKSGPVSVLCTTEHLATSLPN